MESRRLNPDAQRVISIWWARMLALNRFDDAKSTIEDAQARKLGSSVLHLNRYGVAFLEGRHPKWSDRWPGQRVNRERRTFCCRFNRIPKHYAGRLDESTGTIATGGGRGHAQ